jgi:transposase
MRDVELYRVILGLTASWTVVSVVLNVQSQQVTVRLGAGLGPFPCPECEVPGSRYDNKSRRWRHLAMCQFEADVPRVQCASHGIKQVRVPWAEPGSQFYPLFEQLAIDLLRECSVKGRDGTPAHHLGRGLARQGAGRARRSSPAPAEDRGPRGCGREGDR